MIEGENWFRHPEKWFHNRAENEAAICCAINTLEICGTYSDGNVARRRAIKMNKKLHTPTLMWWKEGFPTRATGWRAVIAETLSNLLLTDCLAPV